MRGEGGAGGGILDSSLQSPFTVTPRLEPSGTPGRRPPTPSGIFNRVARDLPAGSTPWSRETDLLGPKSGLPPPRRPGARGDPLGLPASSPANFANFSPGASAEQNLVATAGRSLPSPLDGPGQGAFGRPPPPRGRRATYPGAAVTAGPRRAATCPQPTAPAFAARGPAQPSLLGAGLGAGKRPPSSWEPRRAAPARRAPGRSVTCRTRAGPRARGPEDGPAGQRSRVLPGHSSGKRPRPQRPERAVPDSEYCSWSRHRSLGDSPDPPQRTLTRRRVCAPREPNAAGDLRRRSVKARPLNRSPARERAGSARFTGAPWWRAWRLHPGPGAWPEFPKLGRLPYASLCHCVEVGAEE